MERGRVVAGLLILAGFGVAVGLLSRFQRMVVFPGPEGIDVALLDEVAEQVDARPLRLTTEDGETLYGWHRPSTVDGPRRVLLYFHGNASSLMAQLALQEALTREGWDFVGIHYRGYPGSTGVPGEAGLHLDALASWEFVTEELDTHSGRVVVHGRSLGGGVGAQLAANVNPAGLVLESTFTSLVDVAKERFGGPFFGAILEHRFMTSEIADQIRCPVLVLHGSADTLINVEHGRKLAKLLDADYVEVPGVDHNDPMLVGPLREQYLRFLDSAVPLDAADAPNTP